MTQSCVDMQVRYVRVASENADLVPTVMRAFLGECGLSHEHHAHATRACYLFMRVVKVLRPSLKGYLEELIQGLVPVITAIAANPAQTSSGLLKATQGKGVRPDGIRVGCSGCRYQCTGVVASYTLQMWRPRVSPEFANLTNWHVPPPPLLLVLQRSRMAVSSDAITAALGARLGRTSVTQFWCQVYLRVHGRCGFLL